MVEGGAGVISSFLREGLVDQLIITIAPVFMGGLRPFDDPLHNQTAGLMRSPALKPGRIRALRRRSDRLGIIARLGRRSVA